MTKDKFNEYINNFEFTYLFNDTGWDNYTFNTSTEIQNNIYTITGVAHKKGFAILQITSPGNIPDLNIRKQFEKKIIGLPHDHLLIIINKEKTQAFWQLPLYEDGKFKKLITFSWNKGQAVDGLFQKLRNIVFTLEEEEYLTLLDVKERVNILTANSEKVIKAFYSEFSKEHISFLKFIKGLEDSIPDTENNKKQWYASLMLNRLMFCYFIQKKGFLDDNINYLSDKLKECKKHSGKNNFYSFYRSFLLELFHNELGKPEDKRKKNSAPVPFGKIPYLNGGLFDIHELETAYTKIAIEDKAFERIFAFFDKWNWHLDTRITASGRDINPDVIGYIFEKYINQKEMGAYYTKEDITDYIGKNTIIPFLLDKVKSYYPAPFESGGGFWQYLQDNADEYIYDSVKKGGEGKASLDEVNIPENIKNGIDTSKPNLLERRKDWNTVTPEDIGLPTEIWRETIARLQRYFELRKKISKGNIQEINDLITYNLNIRKLIQDYLEQTQDSMFVRKFFIALTEITILDPTCGSGAFLFAALNILEPLYEVCIHRMEEWLEANPKGNKDFGDRLTSLHLSEHTSLSYFIYKTIILKNLYGVDLMKEAVEIAKLRLFLKLVAEVDPSRRLPNYGLEPLPDIDFNIRSGNTLVGFATEQQLEEVVKNTEGNLIYKEKLDELKTKCDFVKEAYNHFQKIQTQTNSDSIVQKGSKKNLIKELKELDEILNRYLARTYGINPDAKLLKDGKKEYNDWLESHQPFHWFAEFYGIISKGGFDVVIGNPPYVEYSKAKKDYIIKGYETESCGNLYAFVVDKAISILQKNGKIGMIIPISSVSNDKYNSLQNIFSSKLICWFSSYSNRPAKLFENVEQRLTIFIGKKTNNTNNYYSCSYKHWYSKTREQLFTNLYYVLNSLSSDELNFSKTGNIIEQNILMKLNKLSDNTLNDSIALKSNYFTFYHNGPTYFIRAMSFMPNKGKSMQPSTHYKEIVYSGKLKNIIPCLLNSSLFYFFYKNYSNCRDFSEREINHFPIGIFSDEIISEINNLEELIKQDYKENKEIKNRTYESGLIYYEEYYPAKSKPIIDEIDKVLAKHYGFTEEELDFIINYDIKYRMGSELEVEE
jgi:tRNA1(Val) A37 N6-methylase TrmN6